MYKGKVTFTAKLPDSAIAFAPFRFKPAVEGIQSLELHTTVVGTITISVDVSGVTSRSDGIERAHSAAENALNRLAHFNQIPIGFATQSSAEFAHEEPTLGYVLIAEPIEYVLTLGNAKMTVGIGQQKLKAALEPTRHPGEDNFGALRSARLSVGPVEEFMHLYAILLQIFNDSQAAIDAFVLQTEPSVVRTPSANPRANPKPGAKEAQVHETVYTRLRNELAHKRPNVSFDQVKREMAVQVGNLRGIVKQAIDRNP